MSDRTSWRTLVRWLGPLPFVGSWRIAITPVMNFCILASLILALHRRLWVGPGAALARRVVLAASLAGILLILFTMRFGDFSLFAVLQVLVPGARMPSPTADPAVLSCRCRGVGSLGRPACQRGPECQASFSTAVVSTPSAGHP